MAFGRSGRFHFLTPGGGQLRARGRRKIENESETRVGGKLQYRRFKLNKTVKIKRNHDSLDSLDVKRMDGFVHV